MKLKNSKNLKNYLKNCTASHSWFVKMRQMREMMSTGLSMCHNRGYFLLDVAFDWYVMAASDDSIVLCLITFVK